MDDALISGGHAVGIQIVMGRNGDTRHFFDASDESAVSEAKLRFAELTAAGFTAATRMQSGELQIVRAFDPLLQETIFSPRLVGG